MKPADIIVVLGNGFVRNWEIPAHVHDRLRVVAKMYREGVARKIVLCGKWSINYDLLHIAPPVTEAEVMKKVLIRFGIPEEAILKEEQSKDTIGNAFFLKKNIVEPYMYKKLIIVCADFHVRRVQFIFHKIFEPSYQLTFITTPTEYIHDKVFMATQEQVLSEQKKFLAPMKPHQDVFLTERLYADPYYQRR